jgi:hypothetical protein
MENPQARLVEIDKRCLAALFFFARARPIVLQ